MALFDHRRGTQEDITLDTRGNRPKPPFFAMHGVEDTGIYDLLFRALVQPFFFI